MKLNSWFASEYDAISPNLRFLVRFGREPPFLVRFGAEGAQIFFARHRREILHLNSSFDDLCVILHHSEHPLRQSSNFGWSLGWN